MYNTLVARFQTERNIMKCFQCQKEHNNPKFCCRGCSSVYNNKRRKRKKWAKKRYCKHCNKLLDIRFSYCSSECRKYQYQLNKYGFFNKDPKKYICSQCYKLKPIATKVGGNDKNLCKTCYNYWMRGYYKQNYKRKSPHIGLESCIKKRKMIIDTKIKYGCMICGYNKCSYSLHFHHVNKKDKSFTISTGVRFGETAIKNEINKCVILCANCHGEVERDMLECPPLKTLI